MIKSAFTANEYELAYPPGVEHNFWSKSRSLILAKTLVKNNLEKKRVLDIGCGKGVVVSALRNKGIDCYGVEIAEVEPIKNIRNYITTNTDAIELSKEFRDSVEVILLLDVIEHIENVEQFIDSIKKNYVNATHFLIMVPARKELWSNYDEFYGHFRRYDLEMMREISKYLDFRLIMNRYFFHQLFLMGIVSLKIFGKRQIKISAPQGLAKMIHKLIASFFFAEFLSFPGKIPGTSIVALYKR